MKSSQRVAQRTTLASFHSRGPQIRKSAVWIIVLALAALPLAAQEAIERAPVPAGKTSICSSADVASAGTGSFLDAEKRLYLPLSGFGDQTLTVDYLLDGAPYLTETIDLSSFELPFDDLKDAESPEGAAFLSRLNEAARVIELMPLRPDLVDQLHVLTGGGALIDLRILTGGKLLTTLSFKELAAQSAELRQEQVVPVMARSTVEGPGDRGRPIYNFHAKVYLDDCGDCTTSTPCDTECGWDDGKGGPVTCGEYGVCEPPTCDCQRLISESWTGWFSSGFYPATPAATQCFEASTAGSTWHRAYTVVLRRNLVRTTRICPNCPLCTGCYNDQEIIDYQLTYTWCWFDEQTPCYYGSVPSCSTLCQITYYTVCN